MNGQGLSSSYPPTAHMNNASRHSRSRPRKNPHPLAARSAPLLHWTELAPQYSRRATPQASTSFASSPAHFGSKSKSHIQFQTAAVAAASDQALPLDFSVRRSKKRSSIIAFGSNESDTENVSTTASPQTVDKDLDTAAQLLREECQAALNGHLRAQLQMYFNVQQQHLLQQEQGEEDTVDCTGAKKQRHDEHESGESENEKRWLDLYAAAAASAKGMAKDQRASHHKKSSVNGMPVGSGRSKACTINGATRRGQATKRGAIGRVSSRPCSVNNSLNNGQANYNGDDSETSEGCDCSRQQIYVNYQIFIDEHFRRSLGDKKYRELFPSSKSSTNTSASSTDEEDIEEEPVEVTLE